MIARYSSNVALFLYKSTAMLRVYEKTREDIGATFTGNDKVRVNCVKQYVTITSINYSSFLASSQF